MKRLMKYLLAAGLLLAAQAVSEAAGGDTLRVSILGDSYSTFEGWLPRGNAIWYFDRDGKYARTNNDVGKVEETWWYQVIAGADALVLEKNNSYSGATICFTGYKGQDGRPGDYSDRSFIVRASNLGHPDVILVCGGTNDSWCGAQVGEYIWKDWSNEDLHLFRPAMAKMCSELKDLYPEAYVLFILNDQLRDEVNESVHKICRHYHIDCVDLQDIDKQGGHPSQAGMKAFADQVKARLYPELGL